MVEKKAGLWTVSVSFVFGSNFRGEFDLTSGQKWSNFRANKSSPDLDQAKIDLTSGLEDEPRFRIKSAQLKKTAILHHFGLVLPDLKTLMGLKFTFSK